MIKYRYKGLSTIRNKIQSKELKEKWRKSITDFTRKRKSIYICIYFSKVKVSIISLFKVSPILFIKIIVAIIFIIYFIIIFIILKVFFNRGIKIFLGRVFNFS